MTEDHYEKLMTCVAILPVTAALCTREIFPQTRRERNEMA